MNDKISSVSQKPEVGVYVELFEISGGPLGASVLRFTSSAHEGSSIVFDGKVYAPAPVDADGFERSGSGPQPTPTLKVGNANKVAQAAVNSYQDLLGATVRRIRTLREHLDDGADPDTEAIWPIDVFRVERKSAINKVFIEWELASAIDQEGRKLPARQVLKDACTHTYRRWDSDLLAFDYSEASCPYAEASSFDATGAISSLAADQCGKKLSDCRSRYGYSANLPTRAFPGVSQVR